MSLIVIGALAAAAAGLSGLLAARAIARRRRAAAGHADGEGATGATPALLQAPAPHQATPAADLPITLGDVVQVGEASRWPRGCIWVHHDGQLHCAVLMSRDGGTDHATVAFAPPERHILWLAPVELTLPPTPPTRLELEGHLLDRTTMFPAAVQTEGTLPCELGDGAMFACYEGAVGNAAIVLDCGGDVLAFYGNRVAPGDYDNLGQVDPTSDELGSH